MNYTIRILEKQINIHNQRIAELKKTDDFMFTEFAVKEQEKCIYELQKAITILLKYR